MVAFDESRGIGIDGKLPWRLRRDMAHFVSITRDAPIDGQNTVIMGRKTWDSIPARFRPLEGRDNIVLSRKGSGAVASAGSNSGGEKMVRVESDFQNVLSELENTAGKVFVIGGAEIYRLAIEMDGCKRIFATRILGTFNCDAFFPEFESRFTLSSKTEPQLENGIRFQFEVWEQTA